MIIKRSPFVLRPLHPDKFKNTRLGDVCRFNTSFAVLSVNFIQFLRFRYLRLCIWNRNFEDLSVIPLTLLRSNIFREEQFSAILIIHLSEMPSQLLRYNTSRLQHNFVNGRMPEYVIFIHLERSSFLI